MEKKIRDLTIDEAIKICKTQSLSECYLNCPLRPFCGTYLLVEPDAWREDILEEKIIF